MTTLTTDSPEEAAAFIRKGSVAAFPTETVYGLGGSVYDEQAIAAIFKAKQRPSDNPLIAHIADLDQLEQLVKRIPPLAQKLIDAFFPGPLTIIFERPAEIPNIVSAGLDTIAVRMPAHPEAQAFLKACGVPVAAPSANRSGRPSPTNWQDVYTDLKGRIPCILKGGSSAVGIESTVVDCTSTLPRVLRAGGISVEALQTIDPCIAMAMSPENGVIKSPGMKYRHYAPSAIVQLVYRPEEAPVGQENAFIGISPHPYPERLGLHLMCPSIEQYAHELFRFFRRSDRAGIKHIFCQSLPKEGLAMALMDRISKAAAGSTVKP